MCVRACVCTHLQVQTAGPVMTKFVTDMDISCASTRQSAISIPSQAIGKRRFLQGSCFEIYCL